MKVNRTRAGREFREKLKGVNDQVWLVDMISFVFDEFLAMPEHSSDQTLTTRSLLPTYKNAQRLDYNVATLRDFHQKRRHLHLALFLISAFEYASDYVDDVHRFIAENCGLDVPQKNMLPVETCVQNCFEALTPAGLDNKDALLNTLKYFRLMRNTLSHGEGDFGKEFTSYVKSEGKSLNKFWKNFESDEINYSFEETDFKKILRAGRVSALVHFLRIVVDNLDKVYSSLVEIDHVLPLVYEEVLTANPSKRADKAVLTRKTTTLLEIDFGIECKQTDVKRKVMDWINAQ